MSGVTRDECEEYGLSVEFWPEFDDSPSALAYLKQHGKLVILSNVDHASFDHLRRKLGDEFDAVYTAEDLGSYKPPDRNLDCMLEKR